MRLSSRKVSFQRYQQLHAMHPDGDGSSVIGFSATNGVSPVEQETFGDEDEESRF